MSQQHADATADPPSGQPSEVAVVTNQSNDRDIDTALYIDNERFFRDLQDMGLEMTTAERNKYNGNKKKKMMLLLVVSSSNCGNSVAARERRMMPRMTLI